MIRPLREWHRRAAFALAGVVPVVFVAGLLARKSPTAENPAIRWDPKPGAEIRWRPPVPVRLGDGDVKIRRSGDGRWFQVEAGSRPIAPDILIYWSAHAPAGNDLPAGSRLLGSMAASRLPLPGEGYATAYSLAHQSVIVSIRLADLP